MAEIWNLNALCRCCHKDGYFRSMQYPYVSENSGVYIYADWLQEALGIEMFSASVTASTMICEDCVSRLGEALSFKRQVVQCEQKFRQYCMNEEATKSESDYGIASRDIKLEPVDKFEESEAETIKVEMDKNDYDDHDLETDNQAEVMPSSGTRVEKVAKRKGTTVPSKTRKVEKRTTASRKIITRSKRHGIKAEAQSQTETKVPKKPRTVSQKRKPQCTKCATIFKTKRGLMDHHKVCPGYIPPLRGRSFRKCEVCLKSFPQLAYMRHMKSEHPAQWEAKVPVKCNQCGVEKMDDEELRRHMIKHSKSYHCEYCEDSFDFPRKLRAHINCYHHSFARMTCDYCKKDFKTRPVLVKHIMAHMGMVNKRHMCPTCGHRFNQMAHMTAHIRQVHLSIRAYQCEQCPKNYKARKALMEHLRAKHSATLRYKCDKCPKTYLTQEELKRHTGFHVLHSQTESTGRKKSKGYKNLNCPICSLSFPNRGPYRKHLNQVHKGHWPYSCHMCGKTFSSKYVLDRHILSHNEMRESRCDICQKSFKHETFLKAHVKRTHGTKHRDGTLKIPKEDYVVCDICKMKVHDIKIHLKVHFNRPHKCPDCDRSYSQRNALNRHIKETHLRLYRYQCDLCPARFIKWKTVHSHKKKKHPEEYNKKEAVKIVAKDDISLF